MALLAGATYCGALYSISGYEWYNERRAQADFMIAQIWYRQRQIERATE